MLDRLNAKKPDLLDRYHKTFVDLVEEMQIACGLLKTAAYVFQAGRRIHWRW
jgi:hypothetical protein